MGWRACKAPAGLRSTQQQTAKCSRHCSWNVRLFSAESLIHMYVCPSIFLPILLCFKRDRTLSKDTDPGQFHPPIVVASGDGVFCRARSCFPPKFSSDGEDYAKGLGIQIVNHQASGSTHCVSSKDRIFKRTTDPARGVGSLVVF